MQFSTRIEIRGRNPFVLVSAARAEAIQPGWRRLMPVLAQLEGRPEPAWRINMMPRGDGSFYLYLDGRLRRQVGDLVTVSLGFDAEYWTGPQHAMRPAFASALESDMEARARWTGLSPSLRKEVLRYLAALKSDVARKEYRARAARARRRE